MLNWTLVLYYLAEIGFTAAAIYLLGYWLLKSSDDQKLPILGGVAGIIAVIAMFAFLSTWMSIGGILLLLAIGFNPWLPIIPYLFAQGNFFWTIVREGQAKIVLRMGRYEKTLLAKEGHKIDRKNNIVPLDLGDEESKTGLRWVGIWPFWTVYTTTMKYVKALSQPQDGKLYVERNWPGVDFMLAKVAYQYALLFNSCEDKDKLPLSGQITMTARIVNPEKALFRVGNWYDALVSRILPRVRDYISAHTYGQIIGERQLDTEVLKSLQEDRVEGGRTIIEVLIQDYGIELLALEMVNIDPPDGYREATLRQWTAKQKAKAEAEETGGALNLMAEARLKNLANRLGFKAKKVGDKTIPAHETDEFKTHLKSNQALLDQIETQSLDLLRRDRAGTGLRDIRVGNVDGTSLDPVGAFVFSAINSWRGGGETEPKKDDSTKPRRDSRKGDKEKPDGGDDSHAATLEESAVEFFNKHKKYPKWDPLKRTPN